MPPKYRGRTTKHPWTVVVVGRTATAVKLRVVAGPGNTSDKVFWLNAAIFARLYRRVTKG